ncbi:DNA polymerase III subunit gamma and tau, partial [Cryobacterium cheniae]
STAPASTAPASTAPASTTSAQHVSPSTASAPPASPDGSTRAVEPEPPYDDEPPPYDEEFPPDLHANSGPSGRVQPSAARAAPSAGPGTPNRPGTGPGTPPRAQAPAPNQAVGAASVARRGPAFGEKQRYGESVVREILGATFIEEQPHDPAPRTRGD